VLSGRIVPAVCGSTKDPQQLLRSFPNARYQTCHMDDRDQVHLEAGREFKGGVSHSFTPIFEMEICQGYCAYVV
jgi:hypothetical protein